MKIPKNSERRPFTAQGLTLEIPAPFKTGHVCTEGEARVLNQVLVENVRNNLAPVLKQWLKEKRVSPKNPKVAQELVDQYLAEYDFGSTRALATADPVTAMARDLAVEQAKALARAAGKKLRDYGTKQVLADADALLADPAAGPAIRKTAEQMVAVRQKSLRF